MPDDVQAELRGTAEGRRLLASVDRSFFGAYYLGLRYAEHQEVWYDLVDKRRRLLILSPRDHGKTEALCRVIPDQRIAYNRNSRILVVSKIGEEAKKRVSQVRSDLAGNPRLIQDFGAFSPHAQSERERRRVDGDDKETWTQSKFVVAGRTQNLRDPTMEGVGIGGSITGGHFDLIILDDPVDLLEAQSQAQRNMHWNWFHGTVLELCEPDTQIVIIGTRKHADDLYGRIIEDEMTFSVHTDKAILKWPSKVTYLTEKQGDREVVVDVMTSDDYKVLAPWKWSIRDLLLKYQSDSVTFLRENQNELTDDSKSIFRQAYFFGGTVADKPGLVFPGIFDRTKVLLRDGEDLARVEGVDCLQAWDLSLLTDKKKAEARDSDFMVGLSFGYDRKTKDRYLFSMFRDRGLLPTQVVGTIEREAKRFRAIWTAIENNSFGHLHEIGLRRTTDVRIVPHTTDKKKHDPFEGVARLVSMFELGKWHLPYGDAYSRQVARLIMGEFTGLGVEAHDDIVMAFWIAECLIERYENFLKRVERASGRPETRRAETRRR